MLFDEPLRFRVIDVLVREVSENSTPEGMERIRFAVIRLIAENEKNFNVALNHAQMDWRDLFMAAGFADSVEEHRRWYTKVMTTTANRRFPKHTLMDDTLTHSDGSPS